MMRPRSTTLLRLCSAATARRAVSCAPRNRALCDRAPRDRLLALTATQSQPCNARHTDGAARPSFSWLGAFVAAAGAGAGAVCGATVVADAGAGAVEAETGVSFTGWNGARALAGTGCRLMGGVLRVYAVGVYISPVALRASLHAHIGRRSDELLSDARFWTDVCERTEPILRIVVAREVSGVHMASGFERGLTKASGKRSAAHRRFAALFRPLGNMKIGSEIIVRCEKGIVDLVVDGRPIGSVHDAALAPALLAMYLGERAVTPSLKADTARGLADLLADVRL